MRTFHFLVLHLFAWLVLLLGACTTIPPAPASGGMGGDGGQGGSGGVGGQTFPCTEQGVRNAIAAGGGPHRFGCSGPTRVATGAVILIDNAVTLDGEGNLILDGNDDHRVLEVADDTTAELRGMTVTRGEADPGGGIYIGAGADVTLSTCSVTECSSTGGIAGGIHVTERAQLMLIDSTVAENEAFAAGGIRIEGGATAVVVRSTISGNVAVDAVSGGVSALGQLTVTNSTLSSNSFGAIGVASEGSATLINTTIVGLDPENELFKTLAFGGSGTLTMVQSILIGSCDSDAAISGGNNVESPGDTCGLGGVGDAVGVLPSQLNLGPLQQNGGPTRTHEPDSGSLAIDAIDAAECEVDEDQRGIARPVGDGCDVGSVEVVR